MELTAPSTPWMTPSTRVVVGLTVTPLFDAVAPAVADPRAEVAASRANSAGPSSGAESPASPASADALAVLSSAAGDTVAAADSIWPATLALASGAEADEAAASVRAAAAAGVDPPLLAPWALRGPAAFRVAVDAEESARPDGAAVAVSASPVSANAAPAPEKIATPTPRARANPPTRPTKHEAPMTFPFRTRKPGGSLAGFAGAARHIAETCLLRRMRAVAASRR